ncbi:MAG: lipoyl(octanoyl) transferase [Deltaproteobacteria bacterium]|nr:lipoyl(octanoyl) transferase [Deltaproteobacteria bacterium]
MRASLVEMEYSEALRLQRARGLEGACGWLLFSCPPTVTLGRRTREDALRTPRARLEGRGVRILRVDRGGLATFHGPGQIVGFPFGALERHVGDPRGVRAFVDALKNKLAAFVREEAGVPAASVRVCGAHGETGVWIGESKVAAIGLRFSREGIAHGFALNIFADERGTEWGFGAIVPCGEPGAKPAFLYPRELNADEFTQVAVRLEHALASSAESAAVISA